MWHCWKGRLYSVRPLRGIIFDCSGDKLDSHIVYGGKNDFETYRREQLRFLLDLNFTDNKKWLIAIGYICPVKTTYKKGDEFDIEREFYAEWNKELERLGI